MTNDELLIALGQFMLDHIEYPDTNDNNKSVCDQAYLSGACDFYMKLHAVIRKGQDNGREKNVC